MRFERWDPNPSLSGMQTPSALPPLHLEKFLASLSIWFVLYWIHSREGRRAIPGHLTIPLASPYLSNPSEIAPAPAPPLGPWVPQPVSTATSPAVPTRQYPNPGWAQGHHTPEGDGEQLPHDPWPPLGAKPLQRGTWDGGDFTTHRPQHPVSVSGCICRPLPRVHRTFLAAGGALNPPILLAPSALPLKNRCLKYEVPSI